MILLTSKITQMRMPEEDRNEAIEAAMFVTMSTHEWEWTADQQAKMARYTLWATQRLNAIKHISDGKELPHEE